jgi:hypothetical protein
MNTSKNEEKEEISRGNRCKNLWYRWKLTIGDRNEIRVFPITNKIMIIVQFSCATYYWLCNVLL